jgi:hypothetical protein|tara:strand:+ start:4313 stop:6772 length:2460 start_codon:yes stop_codon:yes gene_type:complete
MAIPGLTYRLAKGSSLTHTEMDNNFRSLIYSSSIQDGGDTLHLHFDTLAGTDKHIIPLAGGTGGLTISNNIDNRVVTATGTAGLIQGEGNLTFDGSNLTVVGKISVEDSDKNILIGNLAGTDIVGGECIIAIGKEAGKKLTTNNNVVIGTGALIAAEASAGSVVVGDSALPALTSGDNNVAIGVGAATNVSSGASNIYIGANAGPTSTTSQNNKLYINNAQSDTPLILGDFSTQQITFPAGVTGSSFTGSFFGDGSNLTGLSVSSEWDGSRNGDAEITGSFVVSGSGAVVNFTNTTAISGSIFSGSFSGDGSGLTGVTANAFPHTGSAVISGSLTVINYPANTTIISGSTAISGSLTVNNLSGSFFKEYITVGNNIKIHQPNVQSIGIGCDTFKENNGSGGSTAIGFKAMCLGGGVRNVAVGNAAMQCGGYDSVAIGNCAMRQNFGTNNVGIGSNALATGKVCNLLGNRNLAIGAYALNGTGPGSFNVGLGTNSLCTNRFGSCNTAVGQFSLDKLRSIVAGVSDRNTAIGAFAGRNLRDGKNNVFIGFCAGPAVLNTDESNQLYIASSSGDPLIKGDFLLRTLNISGSMKVSQSISASAFSGDGSGLTNLPGTEWDGTRNGDAEITGSLIVSGAATTTVDFTGTNAISGSTFSGSFVGDGSGLTGVTSEWDGTRNGNSSITGSLVVSGSLDASGTVTLASSGFPGGPGVEIIHFHSSSLSGIHSIHSFAIHNTTGYTGFKADYALTNANESEKRVGTLLGAWDQSGGETINDSHTISAGAINTTAFSIDSDGSTAILKLNASSGTYEVNMLITAFKRQV